MCFFIAKAAPCIGDSGGPLFNKNKSNIYELIGIVSETKAMNGSDGSKTCDPDYAAIFVNVAKYENWIMQKISNKLSIEITTTTTPTPTAMPARTTTPSTGVTVVIEGHQFFFFFCGFVILEGVLLLDL